MDTIWLWYAFVSALVVFSFSPRIYEICWLLFYPRAAESVWSISVIGEWRCCGPVGRSCSALSLFHLPLHPDLLHLQHPDLHHQTTWELIWSEHKSTKSHIAKCYLTNLMTQTDEYGSYNEKLDFLQFLKTFLDENVLTSYWSDEEKQLGRPCYNSLLNRGGADCPTLLQALAGLHKLFHPAILHGRTWSKGSPFLKCVGSIIL